MATSRIDTRIYAYISAAWVELDAVIPFRASWGISDNKPTSRLADVGELNFAVDNSTGLYTPGANTALSGWRKGLPVKMVVTFEGEDFVRFRGNITDIKIRPGNKDKKAYITVSDWLDYSARHPIVNPGVQSNKRGDQIITTVLSEVEVDPQAQSLGTGTETFPTAFDTVTSKTTAYSEFGKVALSELGYVYLTKDRTNGETLVFEGSDVRHGWVEPDTRSLTTYAIDPNPGSLLLEDGSYLLLEDGGHLVLDEVLTNNYTFDGTMDGTLVTNYDAVYGEHVINRMTVYANPRRLSASNEVLFQLDKEIIIPPRISFTLKGTYADPQGGLPINGQSMVTPAATTDYTMFTGSGGTGSDITANLSISITYGSEGFTAILTNSGSSQGYVNKFNTRGIGIYKYNPIEHTATNSVSINEYGTESNTLNQKYQNTLYGAKTFSESVVDEYKNPKTVLNSIAFAANKNSSCMLAFLYNDVGDMIYIDIPEIGIQGNHYIQGVELTINGGIAMVKWILLAALSIQAASGLTPLAVEFSGGAATDAVNFGVINKISKTNTTTISMWINPDVFPTTPVDFLFLINTYPRSLMLVLYDSRIQFGHNFSAGAGNWQTDQNPFTTGGWRHIVITYDRSSASNDPICYVNGSPVTFSEFTTPLGTAQSLDGGELIIGNWKDNSTGNYQYAFDGKIFDPRVYNRILSAAEVTTLYNSGTPDVTLVTSGLVFQGFNVKTSELADYENATITTAMKLRDNAYGAIGTISGTPIGRPQP